MAELCLEVFVFLVVQCQAHYQQVNNAKQQHNHNILDDIASMNGVVV